MRSREIFSKRGDGNTKTGLNLHFHFISSHSTTEITEKEFPYARCLKYPLGERLIFGNSCPNRCTKRLRSRFTFVPQRTSLIIFPVPLSVRTLGYIPGRLGPLGHTDVSSVWVLRLGRIPQRLQSVIRVKD